MLDCPKKKASETALNTRSFQGTKSPNCLCNQRPIQCCRAPSFIFTLLQLSPFSFIPVVIGLLPCQKPERSTQNSDCVFGGVVMFSVHACGGRGASSLTSKSEGALVRGRQAGGRRRCRQSKSEARTRRRRPEAERRA